MEPDISMIWGLICGNGRAGMENIKKMGQVITVAHDIIISAIYGQQLLGNSFKYNICLYIWDIMISLIIISIIKTYGLW